MIVPVEGAELYCSSLGTGPICLVPTVVGTQLYERQMAQLSGSLRLVFVDLRGGGRSTGDPVTLSFDRVAADLEAVRTALGAQDVVVLGHSILGALAIEYGRRCPESVSHVITVGAPPRGDMSWLSTLAVRFFEQDASEERKAAWRDNLEKLPPGTPFERAFSAQAPWRFFDAHTDMASAYQDAQVNPALLAHVIGPLTKDWDVTRDAGSLRRPMLLAHGRYDYTVPYILWDHLEAELLTATRHVFLRSGHQPFFEEPAEFAAVTAAWMQSQEDATRRPPSILET